MISRLHALWKNLFRPNQIESDLDEELRAYEALLSAEIVRPGMAVEEGPREARREMGEADQIKQRVRDIRAGGLVDRVMQDVLYALRTLAKNPAFSTVAILTLALGMGANTAMFNLLDQVVLRLLPVSHPEQLVIVRETGNHYGHKVFSLAYGLATLSKG